MLGVLGVLEELGKLVGLEELEELACSMVVLVEQRWLGELVELEEVRVPMRMRAAMG
jgi:hypothetical protein